jgi:membrane-associated protease RseP (regulator of RpoE activity)
VTIDSHPPEVDSPDYDAPAPSYPTHDRDVSPLVRRFTGSESGRDTRSNPVLLVGLIALIVFGFKAGGWQVMLVVGALVLSVTLHEAGHFIAAKAAGVKVTEFFLGMGPRIFSFRKGETEYGLKLVPVAAYVRPIGANNLEEVDPEDEPRTVRSKTFWRRFSIFFAGPAMNLLIAGACIWALIAFSGVPKSGLFQAQAEPSDWKVAQVVAGSAAANAGIQTDDRIVAFDGQQIGKFSDLHTRIASSAGKTVVLTVDRGGAQVDLTATIGTKDGDPSTGFLGVQSEGIQPPLVKSNPIAAIPKTVAELGAGTIETVKALGSKFSPAGLADLGERVTRGSDQGTTAAPSGSSSSPASTTTTTDNNNDRVISIIGAVGLGADAARTGWAPFLFMIGLINLFLGLVNMLPLLPFDGGHISIAIYEKIRTMQTGREYRADVAKMLPVTYAVVMVFAFIGLSTMYLDIVAPIGS